MQRMALILLVWLAGLTAALAQNPVRVVGSVTPGNCVQFLSVTGILDAGIACGTGLFANPTGAVGLSTVNGSASTAMRSDAAPPLSTAVQSALTGTNHGLLIGTGAFGFGATAAPVSAGTLLYWNGSSWVTLAGNNSGTLILSENSSGTPSWTAAGSGSVQSVTCGTGLSGGTITVTGTCAVSLSTVTNSLSANVSLNNISNYFDGPSTAQGTSGTWFASGQVTLNDASGGTFDCKLWDGTTVIDSAAANTTGVNLTVIHLSGALALPAANIRISCRDSATTGGVMQFNASGNSKDSTLTAFRIQ